MHLSTEFSHWVCVLSGLILIVTSMFSHLPHRIAGNPVSATTSEHNEELLKRLVMVAIGVGAVAYGVSRMVA
jgi:hypothetical protein